MKSLFKKITLLSTSLICGLAVASAAVNNNAGALKANATATAGDLNGGLDVECPLTSDDHLAEFRIQLPVDKQDLSGDGIYIRVKNLTTLGYASPVSFYVNSTNAVRWSLIINSSITLYDANLENPTTGSTRDWGSYLLIPNGFDGHIFIPYSSMQYYAHYGTSSDFTKNSVFALYFGFSTQYDGADHFQFGDVFTDSMVNVDCSAYTDAEFNNIYIADNLGTYLTMTRLANEGGDDHDTFDYTSVDYTGELNKGATFARKATPESDVLASMKIAFTSSKDFSDADDVVVRIKNNANANYPILIYLIDESGATLSSTAGKMTNVMFYDTKIAAGVQGGNAASVKVPYGFDGNMIVPMSVFSGTIDKTKVAAIKISFAPFYDAVNYVFGDIFTLNETTSTLTQIVDVSALTDSQFKANYTLVDDDSVAYGLISRYTESVPSSWIGDVKIIDSLNYATDDELKTNITWDSGDNVCSYNKQDDGMFVHIGPYEAGHTYGNYACLGMFDKGLTTDRKVMYREVNEEKEYAKGITMYLKNLSKREIGITLQFDELATHDKGKSYERWAIVSYPSIYYAYDVKKDANYTFYAKSDQIQIPVGFEGYVRIPFSSYSVPSWCHGTGYEGTDDVLNLDNFTGNFYLTSDTTRYEDLEFFIKNVGVYFNETSVGIFDETHTIKANMGL